MLAAAGEKQAGALPAINAGFEEASRAGHGSDDIAAVFEGFPA